LCFGYNRLALYVDVVITELFSYVGSELNHPTYFLLEHLAADEDLDVGSDNPKDDSA
jgi:hypothetical protein